MEDIKDFDDEKFQSRKNILVYVFGLVIVIAVVFGTIKSVDYFLEFTAPAVAKQEDSGPGSSFLILKRQGNESVLYLFSPGAETEIYRDEAELVNPTVFSVGTGFAFCKRNSEGETEVYTKMFLSVDPPVKVHGISPLNCLYSINPNNNTISYIVKNSFLNAIYRCDLDGEGKTLVISRQEDIMTCPVAINRFEYFYVENNELSKNYKLMKSHHANAEVKHEAKGPIDFIVSNYTGDYVVVLEKNSDTIKIFKDNNFESFQKFSTKKATIKKIMLSNNEQSVYCLICSNTKPDKCKVIEVSLRGEKPERTKELIKSIEPVIDIVLMAR